MIKTSFTNEQKLPLVIESSSDDKSVQTLLNLIGLQKGYFKEWLLGYGALLFRGFEFSDIDQFKAFARHFSGREFFNYAGGVSPRASLTKGIYTSTEYPPELKLALHNELSYSEIYPRHLYFFCEIEPEIGGETTLGDSRRILKNLSPQIAESFKDKKIRYDRCLHDDENSEYSWQAAFETVDRNKVKEVCRITGADFRWQANGSLIVSQIRPATVIHPQTGDEVWFNQADGFHASNLDEETYNFFISNNLDFRLNSFFGDGEAIDVESLEHIRRVLETETVYHRWQKGDVLIVDNLLAAHGRAAFSGARKIALAMT